MTKSFRQVGQTGVQILAWAQVPIALLAVGLSIFVGLQIKPLMETKRDLEEQIDQSRKLLQEYKTQLQNSREAVRFVTLGINAFHQGRYEAAVNWYNQALRLDSENAFILNLKGYSLFKSKSLKESIEALRRSVEVEPKYAWGYFDLARVYCADGDFKRSAEAIKKAVELRPDLKQTMRQDGEFKQLCKTVLSVLD